MAKKPAAKKASKKVAKKAAKKTAKKKAKKSQLIITFEEAKDGVGVSLKGTNVSPQMLAMAHNVLGEAIMAEMTGISPKKG